MIRVVVAHQRQQMKQMSSACDVVRSDSRKSVNQTASQIGNFCRKLSQYSSWRVEHATHLSPFGTCKAVARTTETRMSMSGDIVDVSDKDNKLVDDITTRYETRCFFYDPQKTAIF
jgi:hypothetical protein